MTSLRERWHPTRRRAVADLESAAERGEWHKVYRDSIFLHYQRDGRYGFELAFYRTLAVPSIAELLTQTREMTDHGHRRVVDTANMMLDLMWTGLDGDRGRTLNRAINNAHRGYPIAQEDFTYILCSFIVTPYQHLDLWGWRRSIAVEHEAAHRFYAELGRRMNIHHIPDSYAASLQYLNEYERANLRPTPASRVLTASMNRVILDYAPRPARPTALSILAVMLNDRAVADAMGLPTPRPELETVVRRGMKMRARAIARLPMPTDVPWFRPGQDDAFVYPNGYDVTDRGLVNR